jgi:16S rRNA (cytosine967-C5)-methyltransferase
MTISPETLRTLSHEISKTLRTVFWENVYASKAIQRTLRAHEEWDEKKKAAFTETIYDVIRHWRLLWYLVEKKPSPDDQDLRALLTIYPLYKARRGRDADALKRRLESVKNNRVFQQSLPDWLDQRGEQELGERWSRVIAALSTPADLDIRANTLKITKKELATILRKEGVITKPLEGYPDALRLAEKRNVFSLPSYGEGLFEVQDAASQLVSHVLDPQGGMRVVDACAGEGSKALHCATLMKNKGKVIALDTQEWRLKELRKRAVKAGIDTIETRYISSAKIYKRLEGTADRLLLDVPCSGLGTLRRNPDVKWKLTNNDLERLIGLQQELIERYYLLTKPGGRMVYSVCSVLPSEGEKQIARFLRDHSATFRLISEKRCWPDTDNTDGFYMALLERLS